MFDFIAVCDDDPVMVETVVHLLRSTTLSDRAQIITANSGEELLEKRNLETLQVAVLDMEMKKLNGIETGQALKELNPDILLIFLTGHKQYALEAFGVDSFQYLLKPVTEEKFLALMHKARHRLTEIQAYKHCQQQLLVRSKDQHLQLKYSQILYFEKQLRKIIVYTDDRQYDFNGTLKELQSELDANCFLQCHQGFLVNKSKIFRLSAEGIHLTGCSRIIPVSRRYRSIVRESLEASLFG